MRKEERRNETKKNNEGRISIMYRDKFDVIWLTTWKNFRSNSRAELLSMGVHDDSRFNGEDSRGAGVSILWGDRDSDKMNCFGVLPPDPPETSPPMSTKTGASSKTGLTRTPRVTDLKKPPILLNKRSLSSSSSFSRGEGDNGRPIWKNF